MNPKVLKRFLTKYENATTGRDKALALFNALAVAVPAQEIPAFLGDAGDAFIAFIRTMQNEDSDVSTAVAYEKDAPGEAYLNALYEKLKAL